MPYSENFERVRDSIIDLDSENRRRLTTLMGFMSDRRNGLGPLKETIRALATLDDDDLERIARWFSAHVTRWGYLPRPADIRRQTRLEQQRQDKERLLNREPW